MQNQNLDKQIKIIKLVNGDDIVAKIPEGKEQMPENSPLLRLYKPLQIKYVPQMTNLGLRDFIALIRWTNYTNDNIITIPKDKIMTITIASSEMNTSYHHLASDYDKMDKPKKSDFYKQKPLSPEENRKLNDIFKDFEEDLNEKDPTIH
jgi:hypothetical protein